MTIFHGAVPWRPNGSKAMHLIMEFSGPGCYAWSIYWLQLECDNID